MNFARYFASGYLLCVLYLNMRRDKAVGIATGYGVRRSRGRNSSPNRGKIFYVFQRGYRSTQPPMQWVFGLFPRG